jgi:hypothetical protein
MVDDVTSRIFRGIVIVPLGGNLKHSVANGKDDAHNDNWWRERDIELPYHASTPAILQVDRNTIRNKSSHKSEVDYY